MDATTWTPEQIYDAVDGWMKSAYASTSIETVLVPGTEKSYEPSPFSLSQFNSESGNYNPPKWEDSAGKYDGDLKILVIMTAETDMTMDNGNIFSTGNHPVETLSPMLHFQNAGFEFDIATIGGKPGRFELWALPKYDEDITKMYEDTKEAMAKPMKIEDIDVSLDKYAAIFLPGGHGPMIKLPDSEELGELLRSAHEKELPTISICHGPATLLSTLNGHDESEPFIYDGYEFMVFPDVIDELSPQLGYLPGGMPYWLEKTLIEKGMKSKTLPVALGGVHVHKELISGDSPAAADGLGLAATPKILEYVTKKDATRVTVPNPNGASSLVVSAFAAVGALALSWL